MNKKRNALRNHLNALFEISKPERNGIIIVILLIVAMIIYNFSAPYIFYSEKPLLNQHIDEIDNWIANNAIGDDNTEKPDYNSLLLESTEQPNRKLFIFNPNTATNEEWIALGFKERNIQSLRKYLAKGGTFKIKSDLAKMYFITTENYQALKPYIDLPESIERNKQTYDSPKNYNAEGNGKYETKKYDDANLKVEINSADTTELKRIKGIGSFTAKKIIQFREHLGGYTSIDQLIDVYPLNAERLDSIRKFLIVDLGLMKKININEVPAEQLSKHPYLTSAQAKSIIAYRNMHGKFNQVEDIKKSVLIDQNTFEKVKDYLRVN